MSEAVAAAKAAARRTAFAQRKAAHAAGGAQAAQAAARRFMEVFAPAAGAVVGGYRPIRSEIDPTPLMAALVATGVRLSVPKIEAPDAPLTFLAWSPDAPMVAGAFGAEIPADERPVTPSLLIAPLVAFDERCARLGYGGGFYDRTLERLMAFGPVLAIGLAYDAQRLAAVPTEATDRTLDAVVTEKGVYRAPPLDG